MNTIINFELAKLLKEKEFDNIECKGYYHICEGYTKGYAFCYSNVNKQYENAILTPTIAEVIVWLYDKHGVWVSISMENNEEDNISFYYSIVENVHNETYFRIRKSNFSSPTEAYEAAIDYTLNYLI